EADADVLVGREVDRSTRDGLERLLGLVPEDGRGVEPDLRAFRRRLEPRRRLAVQPDVVVERALEVGVNRAVDDDPVDGQRPGALDLELHERADPDRRVWRGPEVELVRRVRLPFRADDAADRRAGRGHCTPSPGAPMTSPLTPELAPSARKRTRFAIS